MKEQYILRERDEAEINRLGFQHAVWQQMTNQAIEMAGITPGEELWDLGCGPGYLSKDLLEKTGPEGKVVAIDSSPTFIEYLKEQDIRNLDARQLDILKDLERLPAGQADKIFCRWVLMFLPDTERVLAAIHRLLKPGGKFVSIEYFRFREMSVWPESAHFQKLYAQVYRLLQQGGGDPDLGGKMPELMEKAGFVQMEVQPVYRTGKSGSPLWEWISQTNPNHENLVRAGLLTAAELEAYHQDWAARGQQANAFVLAPPIMISVGAKRID